MLSLRTIRQILPCERQVEREDPAPYFKQSDNKSSCLFEYRWYDIFAFRRLTDFSLQDLKKNRE
jgi:hypothetical protein